MMYFIKTKIYLAQCMEFVTNKGEKWILKWEIKEHRNIAMHLRLVQKNTVIVRSVHAVEESTTQG